MTTLDDRPDTTTAPAEYTARDDAVYLAAVLEGLAESTAELDDATTRALAAGMDLADLGDRIADIDALAGQLAAAREMLVNRAATAPGWKQNAAVIPSRGLRFERSQSTTRRWDTPRLVGRLSPWLASDPESGEVFTDKATAERVGRRLLEFLTAPSFRSTALDENGIEYDDVLTTKKGATRIKVFRSAPTDGAA